MSNQRFGYFMACIAVMYFLMAFLLIRVTMQTGSAWPIFPVAALLGLMFAAAMEDAP